MSDANKQRMFLERLKRYPLSILQLQYGMEDASEIPPPQTFKKWLLDPSLKEVAFNDENKSSNNRNEVEKKSHGEKGTQCSVFRSKETPRDPIQM
jgi:hypothetical protein